MLKTRAGALGGGGAHTSTGTRLLRRKEVEATTGLSKSHIYDLMKRGLFPSASSTEREGRRLGEFRGAGLVRRSYRPARSGSGVSGLQHRREDRGPR